MLICFLLTTDFSYLFVLEHDFKTNFKNVTQVFTFTTILSIYQLGINKHNQQKNDKSNREIQQVFMMKLQVLRSFRESAGFFS